MVSDSAGRLWIGSFGAGLWVVGRDRITQVTDRAGKSPSLRFSRLLLDGHLLWGATAGEGLLCYDIERNTWVPVKPDPGSRMRYLHGLARAADGRLLLGSVGSGAASLENGVWHRFTPEQGLRDDWVNEIVPAGDSLWFATSRGVYVIPDSGKPEWLFPQGSPAERDFWEDPEVNVLVPIKPFVFIGTMSNGAFRLGPDGHETKLKGTAGNIQAMLLWRGALWVAGANGIWRIDHHLARPATANKAGFWSDGCQFKSLAISSKGTLLAGTLDGRIFETNDGKTFSLILKFSDGAFRRP